MHEQHPTALGTGPFLVFGFNETANANLPDADQVVNYAQTVPFSIARVQVGEADAGKLVTVNAVLRPSGELLTGLDQAAYTSNRFGNRVIPAAEAGIFLPCISPAKAAVDSARGDQFLAGGKCRGCCHKDSDPSPFNLIR